MSAPGRVGGHGLPLAGTDQALPCTGRTLPPEGGPSVFPVSRRLDEEDPRWGRGCQGRSQRPGTTWEGVPPGVVDRRRGRGIPQDPSLHGPLPGTLPLLVGERVPEGDWNRICSVDPGRRSEVWGSLSLSLPSPPGTPLSLCFLSLIMSVSQRPSLGLRYGVRRYSPAPCPPLHRTGPPAAPRPPSSHSGPSAPATSASSAPTTTDRVSTRTPST